MKRGKELLFLVLAFCNVSHGESKKPGLLFFKSDGETKYIHTLEEVSDRYDYVTCDGVAGHIKVTKAEFLEQENICENMSFYAFEKKINEIQGLLEKKPVRSLSVKIPVNHNFKRSKDLVERVLGKIGIVEAERGKKLQVFAEVNASEKVQFTNDNWVKKGESDWVDSTGTVRIMRMAGSNK